ncbi:MAG: DNA polymerase I [Phycisphaerae bacterium]|nr:DNA polymerase I [Phycisphaerae bacterium]
MPRRSLYFIDGHAQIYRSYYAPFRPLTSPTGEPTKAVYVFFQTLLGLIRAQRPDYLAMVLDTADETVFRVAIDPTYKDNREPPPEDLPPQMLRIVQVLESVGVPIYRLPGYEADDLLATFCRQVDDPELDIVLVSRDKDLDQLLSDRIRLYDPTQDAFFGIEQLREQKGYGPEQAVEAQMLIGDSTDNIRGADGVGPKKAAELLRRFGSVANIIANAGSLTPKLRQSIEAFASRAETVRQLVTLRTDVPMAFDLAAADVSRFDWSRARPIFEALAFSRLLELLPAAPESAASVDASNATGAAKPVSPPAVRADARPVVESAEPRTRATLVTTASDLAALVEKLRCARSFAIDTETTCLSPVDADLVGISVAFEPGSGYYIPVRGVGDLLPLDSLKRHLAPLLADPGIEKCGQNCKYDLVVLRGAGLPVANMAFDSMIASFVLDSSRRSHGIDALALDLLGYRKIATTELIGKGRDQITFDQLPTDRVAEYAAEDADIALRLRRLLEPELGRGSLERLFRELEMPLVAVLAEMEWNGIAIDTKLLERLSAEMAGELDDVVRRIYAAAGHSFNVDSTKQLATVLFDELGLPVIRRTKTGCSTDAEVLEQLAAQTGHPLPALLLDYRELAKLKGTYVDPLPGMVSRKTGRIHPSFNQTVAVTGRLSCSDPNLQNIPIRTESGARIRRAFVAGSPEHRLLKADYSQIELRVLAHFCADEGLRHAFAEDQDIHAFVASQIDDVPIGRVSREQRARAKTVNFGIIYGQSAFGLARQTGMSRTEARQFIDQYFRRYPGIRGFLDACIEQARRDGFVETLFGRRRRIDDINSRNPTARAAAERFAVNTVVQGSAADLIKKAMIDIFCKDCDRPGAARMLVQIHDELVFEVACDRICEESARIRAAMSGALPLAVPVRVDIAAGPNWLDVEPVEP